MEFARQLSDDPLVLHIEEVSTIPMMVTYEATLASLTTQKKRKQTNHFNILYIDTDKQIVTEAQAFQFSSLDVQVQSQFLCEMSIQ